MQPPEPHPDSFTRSGGIPCFPQVEKEGQPKRHAHEQSSGNRCPDVLDISPSSLEPHEGQQGNGGDENIHGEESRDPIREQLYDEEMQIQAVPV
jgi:hypothetical protein